MTIEREMILSVLKLAKNEPVQKDLIAKSAHIATAVADEVLRTLQTKDLVQLKGKFLEIAPDQRIHLAIEAVKKGADLERVCKFLEWKEFENITATAFKLNSYTVKRNLHFKAGSKRWEIDLLAFRKPLIASVDCKHWQHGWSRANIIRAVEAQAERTQALVGVLEKHANDLGLGNWERATLIPIVLSLVPSAFKFYDKTPIVPIMQMQNFISELPGHIDVLTHFTTIVRAENMKLTDF